MKTLASVVTDVMNLDAHDLELLAEAMVWYSSGAAVRENKAEKLQFFLGMYLQEQETYKRSTMETA